MAIDRGKQRVLRDPQARRRQSVVVKIRNLSGGTA
jgi:hypothetical protein